MRLRFARRAVEDITAISAYLRGRNPQGAKEVRADILRCLKLLLLFPQIGRELKASKVRRLVTRKYGYMIYYTVAESTEEIMILTIQHPARDRTHQGH
jgi:toxin ParE1/3/4